VAVEGGARDSEALAGHPKRQVFDALLLDGAQGFVDEGAAEVAVVVTVGGLLFRAWRFCAGANHLLRQL